jgi:hypothetical protein
MLFEILRVIRQGLRSSLLGNKESVKKSGGKMLALAFFPVVNVLEKNAELR